MILILFAIWLLYSFIEGVLEALSDSGNYDYANKHIVYTIQRFVVASGFVIAFYLINHWWTPCLFFALALILSFSFLHNGFYCMYRNIFSGRIVYVKGFKDRGSTAFFDFSFLYRLIQLIISLILVSMLILWLPKIF